MLLGFIIAGVIVNGAQALLCYAIYKHITAKPSIGGGGGHSHEIPGNQKAAIKEGCEVGCSSKWEVNSPEWKECVARCRAKALQNLEGEKVNT